MGLYFSDAGVFDVIRQLEPSKRGELEITSVNNFYIERRQLHYSICYGRWMDAGTFESLFEATALMMENENRIRQI